MISGDINKIYSNDYADFLVNYSGDLSVLEQYKNSGMNIINFYHAVVYLPVTQMTEDVMSRMGYAAVPTLFGLISEASLESSGILRIRNVPNFDLRGKGVLIGIVDSGIDYTNPVFQYADKTTRIASIWDQTIISDNIPAGMPYGTEYTREQINDALKSENPFNTVPSKDEIGHGTMVAGIAAGNEVPESGFYGVAPDAELVIVKLKPAKQYIKQFFRLPENAIAYQENDVIFGVQYLLNYAAQVNKPIVICIALDTSQYAHDGRGTTSNWLSIQASIPNIAILVSVGNEGNAKRHFLGTIEETPGYDTVELNVGPKDKGFSMGYIQNRGMKGKKFLSKEFFDTYESIAKNAKLPLGFCDEGGGMYGSSSMVDEMPRGTSLSWETVETTEQYTIPVCFFAVSCEKDNGLIKTKTLELKNEGDIVDAGKTIYLFQKYHDKSTSGSDMDYLNPKSADIVIECVYEKFKEYCGEYFGKEIIGAFMDIEGDFGYKLAYSDRLKEVYEEMYGENIFVTLPLLFEEDTQGRWMRARYRWYEAVAKTYGEFYDKLVNWCESNNLKFNAHTWEENLYGQVMQIGDFYHVNRKFSITGTDSLRLECYKPRDFKVSLTIADKENKRYMCEVFAAAGNALSASEIKKSVSYMTAWGIDHIIFHGIHTNRSRDAISFAPDTFDNNTYWEGFSQISDYIKRTSYINHITNVCADTVVLNPIDSIKSLLGDYVLDRKNPFFQYISEQREMLLCKHGLEMKEIEDEYTRVINELTKKHIEFYIYDNNYFLNEDFTNIKNIIIPAMCTISKEVLQKIVSLSKEGKKIL
jgi:hypothetical protein